MIRKEIRDGGEGVDTGLRWKRKGNCSLASQTFSCAHALGEGKRTSGHYRQLSVDTARMLAVAIIKNYT